MLPRTLEPEVMDTIEEADDYDQMDHSFVNQLFVDDFLEYFRGCHAPEATTRDLHVVDLGTGTARIPIRLVQEWGNCGPVLACDLSMQMLLLANRNIVGAGLQDRIQTVLCDAKHLPFGCGAADVMLSNSILHHIPDPLLVIQEVARCLKPNGMLFFRDLLRPRTTQELEHLVTTYAGAESVHAQKMFHDSLHAALTMSEVRRVFQAAGLRSVHVCQTSDRHWTAWMDRE